MRCDGQLKRVTKPRWRNVRSIAHAEGEAGDEEHERADEAGDDLARRQRLAGEHVAQRGEGVRAGQDAGDRLQRRRAAPRPG